VIIITDIINIKYDQNAVENKALIWRALEEFFSQDKDAEVDIDSPDGYGTLTGVESLLGEIDWDGMCNSIEDDLDGFSSQESGKIHILSSPHI
jgi:hypothetical protein